MRDVERRFLPTLTTARDRLAARFPADRFTVSSYTLTTQLVHSLYLECLLRDAEPSEPDNLVLDISLNNLMTTPRAAAAVYWNPPGDAVEASFPADWLTRVDLPEATLEVLDQIAAALPSLIAALETAVARRRPPG